MRHGVVMIKNSLLLCPFCGSSADVHESLEEHWIECQECNVSTPGRATGKAAVTAWNRRSYPVVGLEIKRIDAATENPT